MDLPDYWDDLDPEVRALLEEVRANLPPEIKALFEDPEARAAWQAQAKANMAEYEREYGAFTEEEKAAAEAIRARAFRTGGPSAGRTTHPA